MTERAADIPETMRCIEIAQPGGPESLVLAERPTPTPGPDEILIKTAFAGVNRPDVAQRAGEYPPPPGASDLPGLEVSGVVAARGADAPRWRLGDTVVALTPGGGYADYVVAPAEHALPLPKGLDLREGAALPETFFTVWTNVFERGRLQAGETFLVHGGSSGIGSAAIQLANAFGARVFATAGSAEKCAACEALGAEKAINYREADFAAELAALTDGRGADLILDMVGGSYIPRNVKAAAVDGRIVNIAFLQGAKVEVNFALAMVKRLTWSGSTLRPQSLLAKARIADALEREVWPRIEAGQIKPVMDQTFPLAEAAAAHARMETSQHIGNITLAL